MAEKIDDVKLGINHKTPKNIGIRALREVVDDYCAIFFFAELNCEFCPYYTGDVVCLLEWARELLK